MACFDPTLVQLDEEEIRLLREALMLLHELRHHAQLAEAEELGHALCRAGEVLALLTRHRGEVWLH